MSYARLRALAALMLTAVSNLVSGAAHSADLSVGAMAPDFTLPGSDGRQHHLLDYRGTAVVLAWFPKAFTGG